MSDNTADRTDMTVPRKICYDASVIAHAVLPAPRPAEDPTVAAGHARIWEASRRHVAFCVAQKIRIMISAATLAEALMQSDDPIEQQKVRAYLSAFRIVPMDVAVAEASKDLWFASKCRDGQKQAQKAGVTRACYKIDLIVVATAKAQDCDYVVGADEDLVQLAAHADIKYIHAADLERLCILPEESPKPKKIERQPKKPIVGIENQPSLFKDLGQPPAADGENQSPPSSGQLPAETG